MDFAALAPWFMRPGYRGPHRDIGTRRHSRVPIPMAIPKGGGAPPLGVSIECRRTGSIYACEESPTRCEESPFESAECEAQWEGQGEDDCAPGIDCPPAAHADSLEIRASCTGLIPGQDYEVPVIFVDEVLNETTITISFTAASPTETTSWTAGPVPDSTHQQWVMDSYSIARV